MSQSYSFCNLCLKVLDAPAGYACKYCGSKLSKTLAEPILDADSLPPEKGNSLKGVILAISLCFAVFVVFWPKSDEAPPSKDGPMGNYHWEEIPTQWRQTIGSDGKVKVEPTAFEHRWSIERRQKEEVRNRNDRGSSMVPGAIAIVVVVFTYRIINRVIG